MNYNKYVLKYTITNSKFPNDKFVTFVEIKCNDTDQTNEFYNSMCRIICDKIKRTRGILVAHSEIDFEFISLVHSYQKSKLIDILIIFVVAVTVGRLGVDLLLSIIT